MATNSYTVSNSFTGYRATIRPRGDGLPTVGTLQRHIRKSKASDCKSETVCRDDQTGERIALVDRGRGIEAVRAD